MKKPVLMIVVIVVAGIVAFIGFKYLVINTKVSAVDQQRYLGNLVNTQEIYSSSADGVFYSPLNISIAEIDKLMLIDIENDPEYASVELQTFDDARGRGARVLLYRHQGPADSYFSNKAFVIRESGNDSFFLAPDMTYHLEVTPTGLDASLKMRDHTGKFIEFSVREASRKKWSKGFLAPIGASDAIAFEFFPFFYMKDMNFVLRSGTEITIRIDGKDRKPKKLPLPVNWEFVYLSRYSPSPVICLWNRPHEGALKPFQPKDPGIYEDGQTRYELIQNAGHFEIHRILGANGGHTVSFDFSPPIPDLARLKDGIKLKGRFCAAADEASGIVAGEYEITRQGNIVDMEIRPLEGWQPIPGTIWVKSWTWKAALAVGDGGNISMKSHWVRK